MSDLKITLNSKQQEMLLRGLRFVRSSVALDALEWSPEVERQRVAHYQEVAELEGLLTGGKTIDSTATVS